jgi:Fe-S oxidoreductase
MCPIFHFAPREEASPRAKATLARAVMTGGLPADEFTKDDAKAVADLCVHCHQCRLECPAEVDIPKLMLEAKSAYVSQNGLRPRDLLMSRIDTVSAWASRFPRLANLLLTSGRARWALDRVLGLAQGRQIPNVAPRPFLRGFGRRLQAPVRGAVEKVVYFVDTFANHFDDQLAQAFVRILEHNQVGVHSPAGQGMSAMSMISQGALEPARRIAARNVELLSELVRDGYTVVATEPSAALALRHEYPTILGADDDDTRLVAENTVEACDYLWKLHQRGRLNLDFRPAPYHVAYHVPCHVRALGVGAPAGNLLRLLPQLRLVELEKGCSGMAGLYGMKRENYRRSLRAGLPLLTELRTGGYDLAVSECSSCAIQMRHGMPKTTLHPLKLVAMSYGLAPALEAQLKSTLESQA